MKFSRNIINELWKNIYFVFTSSSISWGKFTFGKSLFLMSSLIDINNEERFHVKK